jgi:hypothetical protein
VIQVWGPHERNDLEAMKEIARPFFPPRPADAPAEPEYSKPGALEDIAREAALTPQHAFDTSWSFEYPDDETLARALIAPAGLAVLVGPEREAELKRALIDGLGSHRNRDGGYRLSNTYHYLVARA